MSRSRRTARGGKIGKQCLSVARVGARVGTQGSRREGELEQWQSHTDTDRHGEIGGWGRVSMETQRCRRCEAVVVRGDDVGQAERWRVEEVGTSLNQ